MTTHPDDRLAQQGCDTCGRRFHVTGVILQLVNADMRIRWVTRGSGAGAMAFYEVRVTGIQLGDHVEAIILTRFLRDSAALIAECEALRDAGYARVDGHLWFERSQSGSGERPQISFCEHYMDVTSWSPVQKADAEKALDAAWE